MGSGANRSSQHAAAGVVLPGGGARAAYQVGVLQAIAEWTAGPHGPFPVICGTSAGAINAAVLASHAHEFAHGVDRLAQFWGSMRCDRVYRTDAAAVASAALRWFGSLVTGGRLVRPPLSLLDNQPLRQFLGSVLRLDGIEVAIEQGALTGVSVTASAYTRASAVSFFQAQEHVDEWKRSRRSGERTRITLEHLLGSAALPFIFPAEQIGEEFFGDGGMRMVAPLSPAIHLGADRLLVISNRDERPDPRPTQASPPPSFGEIGGYLLDTIFMDNLNADLARLQRINSTLASMPGSAVAAVPLRHIETMVIRPSRDLRDVTREHVADIPPAVRQLLKVLGGWGRDWRIASYLLFEAPYCLELMELGYRDGQRRRDDIQAFLEA